MPGTKINKTHLLLLFNSGIIYFMWLKKRKKEKKTLIFAIGSPRLEMLICLVLVMWFQVSYLIDWLQSFWLQIIQSAWWMIWFLLSEN